MFHLKCQGVTLGVSSSDRYAGFVAFKVAMFAWGRICSHYAYDCYSDKRFGGIRVFKVTVVKQLLMREWFHNALIISNFSAKAVLCRSADAVSR